MAGAAIGAAATSSYYGPRYYGGPAGYGYYSDAYAYDPAYSEPVYSAPVYAAPSSYWIATYDARGYGYYGPCTRFSETHEARQAKIRPITRAICRWRGGLLPASFLHAGDVAKPVDRALQDEGRRVLVDHRGALCAADIGRDQFALDRGGRKPLIP